MARTDRIACPYCGATTTRVHPPRCPDNPDVRARILAALTDPDKPGYAISKNRYTLHSSALNLPAELTLKRHYGSWAAFVAAFGLKSPPVGRRTQERKPRKRAPRNDEFMPCPHCAMSFRSSNMPRHTRCCLHRPGLRERLRTVIEVAPGCGYGISMTDYRRRVDAWRVEQPKGTEPLPAPPTIHAYFPEWDGFLHWLGLVSEDEIIDARAAADNARYRAEWQEHHARELEPWGLPVASVQKPTPWVRRLPSGGTATMIR